jgi:hypothetical protein
MRELSATAEQFSVLIEIGGAPIRVNTTSADFRRLLEERYSEFKGSPSQPAFELDVDLTELPLIGSDEGVRVKRQGNDWAISRGDFQAVWEPESGRGRIRQPPSPYSIDSAFRIIHTLILAREGGFLVHAASAVRGGKAYVFAGESGAGKTTLSRLAPPDVTILTDEISYVRKGGNGYTAFGTPFAGELARVGANTSAPLSTLYLLRQGPENRIDPVPPADAARELLKNILFFAEDQESVGLVFQAACEFVARVPVCRMTFLPDQSAWEVVG